MTTLVKSVKPNFVSNPNDLLETKAAVLLDARPYVTCYEMSADQLFEGVESGAYVPWTSEPLFTASEKLFTHRDTYAYFPEISSPIMMPVEEAYRNAFQGKRTNNLLLKKTVGDPIDWRTAVEKPVNVYNKAGNLLVKATQNRDRLKLIYNPGPEIHALRFLADLAELTMLEATAWGSSVQTINNISKYVQPDINLDDAIRVALEMNAEFFNMIKDFVSKDPWLVYKINTYGSTVVIESSCDYRHFKCNEALLAQMNVGETDDTVLTSYRSPEIKFGLLQYDDLEGLYQQLFEVTGHQINSIPELFELLDSTKRNPNFTNAVMSAFKIYLENNKKESSQARQLIKKIASPGFIDKMEGELNGLKSSSLTNGNRIYIF